MSTVNFILLIILVAMIAYSVTRFFYLRKVVKILPEEDFKAGYRKGQLIDLREPDVYRGGHILGARNIPVTQLRNRLGEVRTDQPVYLYDQNGVHTGRAGSILKKHGCKEMYQLKGGFKLWGGRIKKK